MNLENTPALETERLNLDGDETGVFRKYRDMHKVHVEEELNK